MGIKTYRWLVIVVIFLRILTPAHGQVSMNRAGADSLGDVGNASSVIKPWRGYVKSVEYFETSNELVSFHIGTIAEPVTPFADLPKIIEISKEWPHVNTGDEVYDITGWFPLKDMRVKGKEDKRWVYYNKTNGYIIANADQFLRASIYDYGMNVLESMLFKPSVSVICVEVSDKTPLNREAIFNSSHKLLWKSSSMMHASTTDEVLMVNGNKLKANAFIGSDKKSIGVELDMMLVGDVEQMIKTNMLLPVNKWMVNDCGISDNDRSVVMLMKADVFNLHGDMIKLAMNKKDFVIREKQISNDDPFGDETHFSLEYRVPSHMIDLFVGSSEEKKSPENSIKIDSDEMEIGINASDLLKIMRVYVEEATFYKSRSSLLVYSSEYEHENVEYLLSEDFGGQALAKKVRARIYEIDVTVSTTDLDEKEWKLEDVLAGNPDKVLSFGGIVDDGQEAFLSSGTSKCEFWLTGGWDNTTRVYELGCRLSAPNLKIDYQRDMGAPLKIPEGKPIVTYMGSNSENGKPRVMIIQVNP